MLIRSRGIPKNNNNNSFFNLLGSFSHFDYGPEDNLQAYGTITPPEYNLKNVRVPVRIYYAQSDTIANPEVTALFNDNAFQFKEFKSFE